MNTYPRYALSHKDDISRESTASLSTIRKLDKASEAISSVLDKEIHDLAASSGKQSPDLKRIADISKMKRTLDILAGRKVDLAVKLYDFLDLNVKLIDSEMTKLEEAILERGYNLPTDGSRLALRTGSVVGVADGSAGDEQPVKRKRGRPRLNSLTEPVTVVEEVIPPTPAAVLNEPVYCICNRVAFGEMIACDNEDCPIEWYHYPCVNLTRKPRNSWICHLCSNKKKK